MTSLSPAKSPLTASEICSLANSLPATVDSSADVLLDKLVITASLIAGLNCAISASKGLAAAASFPSPPWPSPPSFFTGAASAASSSGVFDTSRATLTLNIFGDTSLRLE